MSVQVLSSSYISKVNPQQVDQWVKDGYVIKQGNQYYVKTGSQLQFPESCFEKDGDKIKTYQLNGKGLIVESSAPKGDGEVIGKPQTTYNINLNQLCSKMGLSDGNLQTEFVKFLETKGLKIGEGGDIAFSDVKGLNKALKEFAEVHKANFVDSNAQKYVEFTEDSDSEMIDKLKEGEKPAIDSNPTEPNNRRYAVKNLDVLNDTLKDTVGETKYENSSAKSNTVDAGITTTTTRQVETVNVPENLHGSKAARKALKTDAEKAYADLVANADPATREAIDLYIAERKYNKQIDKKMQDLSTYTTSLGGSKEKKVRRDGADIIQYYIDNYANSKDKAKLNDLITKVQNSQNTNDKTKILNELKEAGILTTTSNYDELPAELKRKGALLSVAKACGYSSNTLLRLMATKEVMADRTSSQSLKDDEYFIKAQAKDFVKNKQASQDIGNTTVFFSKSGRKKAKESNGIHTDIGDKGRALVKACPEMLCDEITDPSQFNPNEDGAFKAEIGGKPRYFKFSSDKWKTFMGICCDPSRATDDAMKVLFGDDKTKKDAFLKDLNLTLQEGRGIMQMSLPSPYGETGTVAFESIIGKSNGVTSNKELNALRDMVKSAGYSVDSNTTAGKRLLHVLKNAGLGAGIGVLTGGLGSLLSGAVTVAGQTAEQAISLTGTATLGYSDVVTTTDTTNTILPNGQTIADSTIHNTTVTGETTGDVTLEGKAPGQNYRDSGNNHLKTAGNAGMLGAIAGVAKAAATMRGVQERGRNIDDVFSLTRVVQDDETENKPISIEIPQFVEVQTRKGEMTVGTEIPKLKAVAYRGPEAYHGLYEYEDGSPVSPRDFAKAYKTKVSGNMTNFNFFVFPELEVNGKKIVPVDDYEAQYKKIKKGTPGNIRGVNYHASGTKTVRAQGTIK